MDFGWYPFDAHNCSLKMTFPNDQGIIINGGESEPRILSDRNWIVTVHPSQLTNNGKILSLLTILT